jgi:signal transduction histidine kinase
VDRAKIKLTLRDQNLSRAAAMVLAELQPLIKEKEHRVLLDFPEDLPPVRVDAERLRQILHILLDNAVKYTPTKGEIRLRARCNGDFVQVDIIDNGPGIPESEKVRIFSKFFRGEGEQIRKYAGLGLNLYIARGLARLQGGELCFESVPGKGSMFRLNLPAHKESRQG